MKFTTENTIHNIFNKSNISYMIALACASKRTEEFLKNLLIKHLCDDTLFLSTKTTKNHHPKQFIKQLSCSCYM